MKKRILSILCAIALLVSMLSVGIISAAAEDSATLSLQVVDDQGNAVTEVTAGDTVWAALYLSDYATLMGENSIASVGALLSTNVDKWTVGSATAPYTGTVAAVAGDEVIALSSTGFAATAAELDAQGGLLCKVQLTAAETFADADNTLALAEAAGTGVATSIVLSDTTELALTVDTADQLVAPEADGPVLVNGSVALLPNVGGALWTGATDKIGEDGVFKITGTGSTSSITAAKAYNLGDTVTIEGKTHIATGNNKNAKAVISVGDFTIEMIGITDASSTRYINIKMGEQTVASHEAANDTEANFLRYTYFKVDINTRAQTLSYKIWTGYNNFETGNKTFSGTDVAFEQAAIFEEVTPSISLTGHWLDVKAIDLALTGNAVAQEPSDDEEEDTPTYIIKQTIADGSGLVAEEWEGDTAQIIDGALQSAGNKNTYAINTVAKYDVSNGFTVRAALTPHGSNINSDQPDRNSVAVGPFKLALQATTDGTLTAVLTNGDTVLASATGLTANDATGTYALAYDADASTVTVTKDGAAYTFGGTTNVFNVTVGETDLVDVQPTLKVSGNWIAKCVTVANFAMDYMAEVTELPSGDIIVEESVALLPNTANDLWSAANDETTGYFTATNAGNTTYVSKTLSSYNLGDAFNVKAGSWIDYSNNGGGSATFQIGDLTLRMVTPTTNNGADAKIEILLGDTVIVSKSPAADATADQLKYFAKTAKYDVTVDTTAKTVTYTVNTGYSGEDTYTGTVTYTGDYYFTDVTPTITMVENWTGKMEMQSLTLAPVVADDTTSSEESSSEESSEEVSSEESSSEESSSEESSEESSSEESSSEESSSEESSEESSTPAEAEKVNGTVALLPNVGGALWTGATDKIGADGVFKITGTGGSSAITAAKAYNLGDTVTIEGKTFIAPSNNKGAKTVVTVGDFTIEMVGFCDADTEKRHINIKMGDQVVATHGLTAAEEANFLRYTYFKVDIDTTAKTLSYNMWSGYNNDEIGNKTFSATDVAYEETVTFEEVTPSVTLNGHWLDVKAVDLALTGNAGAGDTSSEESSSEESSEESSSEESSSEESSSEESSSEESSTPELPTIDPGETVTDTITGFVSGDWLDADNIAYAFNADNNFVPDANVAIKTIHTAKTFDLSKGFQVGVKVNYDTKDNQYPGDVNLIQVGALTLSVTEPDKTTGNIVYPLYLKYGDTVLGSITYDGTAVNGVYYLVYDATTKTVTVMKDGQKVLFSTTTTDEEGNEITSTFKKVDISALTDANSFVNEAVYLSIKGNWHNPARRYMSDFELSTPESNGYVSIIPVGEVLTQSITTTFTTENDFWDGDIDCITTDGTFTPGASSKNATIVTKKAFNLSQGFEVGTDISIANNSDNVSSSRGAVISVGDASLVITEPPKDKSSTDYIVSIEYLGTVLGSKNVLSSSVNGIYRLVYDADSKTLSATLGGEDIRFTLPDGTTTASSFDISGMIDEDSFTADKVSLSLKGNWIAGRTMADFYMITPTCSDYDASASMGETLVNTINGPIDNTDGFWTGSVDHITDGMFQLTQDDGKSSFTIETAASYDLSKGFEVGGSVKIDGNASNIFGEEAAVIKVDKAALRFIAPTKEADGGDGTTATIVLEMDGVVLGTVGMPLGTTTGEYHLVYDAENKTLSVLFDGEPLSFNVPTVDSVETADVFDISEYITEKTFTDATAQLSLTGNWWGSRNISSFYMSTPDSTEAGSGDNAGDDDTGDDNTGDDNTGGDDSTGGDDNTGDSTTPGGDSTTTPGGDSTTTPGGDSTTNQGGTSSDDDETVEYYYYLDQGTYGAATGDASNVLAACIVMILSTLSVAYVLISRKRKQN